MEIEICEQAVKSWLQHIKGCQIVQTNWMISPLFDLDPYVPYVEWFMKDVTEKLNDEIDAQTAAEFMLVGAMDSSDESDEMSDMEDSADMSGMLSQDLLDCFAVLNKKETAAMRGLFGKSKPKQFVTQCEIDDVGIKLNVEGNKVERIFLVDSAFHKATLNYGDAAARVMKKIIRACVVAEIVFGRNIPIEVAFATPYCSPGLSAKITDLTDLVRKLLKAHYSPTYDNIEIKNYFNDTFADEIYLPLRDNLDDLNNHNDLFVRSLNLAKIAEKNTSAPSTNKGKSGSPAKKSPKLAGGSSLNYEMAADYMRNKNSLSAIGTKYLPTPDPNGSKTQSRLKPLGVLGKQKGLLIGKNIDDVIANTTDPLLKSTLNEIKRLKL